jgi:tRNA (guanine-N7-)-methyltransferase
MGGGNTTDKSRRQQQHRTHSLVYIHAKTNFFDNDQLNNNNKNTTAIIMDTEKATCNNNKEEGASSPSTTTKTTTSTTPTSRTNKKRTMENNDAGVAVVAPITADGEMPQKKFYRQRAHCNPLSHNNAFEYPISPDKMDWSEHYPAPEFQGKAPTVLDIGCGFGGLTIALATILPEELVLGMEIRAKVTEYVRLRIMAFRKEHTKDGQYQNCSVMRTNSMKFLPHYFPPQSLTKLFFCFPDPHFKRKNHGRRIVSERLLSEYAYVLKVTGRLYCITDVKALHQWHLKQCQAHSLFRQLSDDEVVEDPCVAAMRVETEEGKKVERNKGNKYYAVFERIDDSKIRKWHADNFFVDQEEEEDDDDGEEEENGGDDAGGNLSE